MRHWVSSVAAAIVLSLSIVGVAAAAGAAPYATVSYTVSGTQGSHVVNVTATATSGSAGAFQSAAYTLHCNGGLSGSGGRITFRKGVATFSVYVGDVQDGSFFVPENCPTFVLQLWTNGTQTTPLSDPVDGTIP